MRVVRWSLTLVLLAHAFGLHWAALQSIAWTRMVFEYSRTQSFGRAVAWTLDGRHPCRMCLAIREARRTAEPRSPEVAPSGTRWECDLPSFAWRHSPRIALELPAARATPDPESRREGPPKPRPRFVSAA